MSRYIVKYRNKSGKRIILLDVNANSNEDAEKEAKVRKGTDIETIIRIWKVVNDK